MPRLAHKVAPDVAAERGRERLDSVTPWFLSLHTAESQALPHLNCRTGDFRPGLDMFGTYLELKLKQNKLNYSLLTEVDLLGSSAPLRS